MVFISVFGSFVISSVYGIIAGQSSPIYSWITLVASIIGLGIIPFLELVWRPLWRLIPFLGKTVFPDLNGTWRGELQSSWKVSSNDNPLEPIPTTFFIKQGLLKISVRMQTQESKSGSIHCIIERDKNLRQFRLWYAYHNHPKVAVQDWSHRHDGAACLEMSMDSTSPQMKLEGQYFTQRKTSGDIFIERISPRILDS
jgi:hypothetical protein